MVTTIKVEDDIFIEKHDGGEHDLIHAQTLKLGIVTVELGFISDGKYKGDPIGGYLWYNVYVGPDDGTEREYDGVPNTTSKMLLNPVYGKNEGVNKAILCSAGRTGLQSCSQILAAYILNSCDFDY